MNSIPMTADGLKQDYEYRQRCENEFRENAATARRLLTEASRDRKKAYRRWQDKIKEAAK